MNQYVFPSELTSVKPIAATPRSVKPLDDYRQDGSTVLPAPLLVYSMAPGCERHHTRLAGRPAAKRDVRSAI